MLTPFRLKRQSVGSIIREMTTTSRRAIEPQPVFFRRAVSVGDTVQASLADELVRSLLLALLLVGAALGGHLIHRAQVLPILAGGGAALWLARSAWVTASVLRANQAQLLRVDANELEYWVHNERRYLPMPDLLGARLLPSAHSALYGLIHTPPEGLEIWFLEDGRPKRVQVDWKHHQRVFGHVDSVTAYDGNEFCLKLLTDLWKYRVSTRRETAQYTIPDRKFTSNARHSLEIVGTELIVRHDTTTRRVTLASVHAVRCEFQPIGTSARLFARRLIIDLDPRLKEAPVEIQLGRLPENDAIIDLVEFMAARFSR
jgi:hypothetical protein